MSPFRAAFLTLSLGAPLLAGCLSTRPSPSTPQGQDTYGDYTIYRWPAEASITPLDLKALEREVRQYSELVGTCLMRDPEGASELDFLCSRDDRLERVLAASSRGEETFCSRVRKEYVDAPYLVGKGEDRSRFCQYGNCREGVRVHACLARAFGFSAKNIRVCATPNDHIFAMVRSSDNAPWCLMDRWKKIDHFHCPVDVDTTTRVLMVDGQPYSKDPWYTQLTCVTFDEFARTGKVPLSY
jgi:hypothetical protein